MSVIDRRNYLKTSLTGLAGSLLPGSLAFESAWGKQVKSDHLFWGNLLHLSMNMWEDRPMPHTRQESRAYDPTLRCDEALWNDLLHQMADAGMNLLVIDLGDGVRYKSHPEIAVENAWSVEKLQAELTKARRLGLEPIPKFNFSTAHDTWLGKYSRMVSTDVYYQVVEDLISEVVELFDKPRFFHLGMDEETADHQRTYLFSQVRQNGLWWRDVLFYIRVVEKNGSCPWVWSDPVWRHREEFLERMPKSVLQSNWYYSDEFDDPQGVNKTHLGAYSLLEQHGYDQVPTGSNYSNAQNFDLTVQYCTRTIAPERLLGFLQTPWQPTLEPYRQKHEEAINQVGAARAKLLGQ